MKIINGYENCNKEKKVLAFGNFDGIHLGHSLIISTVKKKSNEFGIASAILTFEPHPASVIHNRQDFILIDFEQKAEIISSYGIDYLYLIKFDHNFSTIKPYSFISKVLIEGCNVKHIVVGKKCLFGHKCQGNIELLQHCSSIYNYDITILEPICNDGIVYSSSLVRGYLRGGNVESANKILGRTYQINGKVIKGLARGKTIGFPTANINIDHVITPKLGVYYAQLRIKGQNQWLNGLANIGIRPTFNDLKAPIMEMYIFNFSDELYDQFVEVKLLKFIRAERKFNSINELKQQIYLDIAEVKLRYNT